MKRREMEMEVEKEGKETGPHHHTSVIAFSSHVLSIRGGFTDLTPDVWFPWRERERRRRERSRNSPDQHSHIAQPIRRIWEIVQDKERGL